MNAVIWPELWLCLLCVVLNKRRVRNWINKHSSSGYLDRYDRTHLCADSGRPHLCCCPVCVSEFEPFFRWVRIA